MNESPILDRAALENLHRLGGPKFVLKMIDLFLSYVAGKIAEARSALAAGDVRGVEKAAHPIRSSAANIGARHVQDLAQRLESQAAQKKSDGLAQLVGELEQAFAALRPELEATKQSSLCQSP